MSIIHNALKKAQDDLAEKEQKSVSSIYDKLTPKPADPANTADDKKTTAPKTPGTARRPSAAPALIFFVVLALLGGGVYAAITFLPESSVPFLKPVKRLIQSKLPPPSPNAPAPVKASVLKTKSGSLKLSGTIVMGKNSAAIINGETYRLGDTVDGYTITNISVEKVEFQTPEGPITLKVNQSY